MPDRPPVPPTPGLPAALAAGALLILGSLAGPVPRVAADRVAPPPTDCPPGSLGHTEHAGQWCEDAPCEADAECGQGVAPRYLRDGVARVCREVALCVVEERYQLGHRTLEPEYSSRTVARGPCIEGACPSGGECRRAARCVATDAAEPAPREPAESPSASTERAPTPSAGTAAAPDPDPGSDEGGGCAIAPSAPRRTGSGWRWTAALPLLLPLLLVLRRP